MLWTIDSLRESLPCDTLVLINARSNDKSPCDCSLMNRRATASGDREPNGSNRRAHSLEVASGLHYQDTALYGLVTIRTPKDCATSLPFPGGGSSYAW